MDLLREAPLLLLVDVADRLQQLEIVAQLLGDLDEGLQILGKAEPAEPGASAPPAEPGAAAPDESASPRPPYPRAASSG